MDQYHPYADIAPALLAASQTPDAEVKVAEVIACLLDGELDEQTAARQIGDFMASVATAADAGALCAWFQKQGFGRQSTFTATADHSNIVWVAEHRSGLPIVLALLLVGAARTQGLAAHGVNYPGHFLAEVDSVLIDPLTMQAVAEGQIDGDINGLMAAPEGIALRMLNNLKSLAHGRADYAEVLNLLDLQLHIASSPQATASLYYEQAEVWLQFGSVSAARSALQNCQQQAGDSALGKKAQQRLAQLSVRDEHLH